MQLCLDTLSDYCAKNCLSVNLKKTQVLVFGKGKVSPVCFYYRTHLLEHVSSYKYLGIVFSSNGSFSICQEDLYKRALKAYFKISKYFVNVKASIRTFLKLFDHTVKPILLYACEIWGTININSCIVKKDEYIFEHSFKNLYCDKLHLKSLKYILGVHKYSVNDAVLGETGRYPLYINMLTQSTKYFSRLLNAKPSTLIFSAFQESLALHRNSKSTWVSSMFFLFDKLKITPRQHYDKNLSQIVKTKAIREFKTNWLERLNKCQNEQSGKLRTYAQFKKQFMYEPYLDYIKDPVVRV